MIAAYRRTSTTRSELAARVAAEQVRRDAVIDDLSADSVENAPAPARYGEYGSRGPNWTVIGLILLAHAALLFALVKLDVIHVGKAAPPPLVIELITEMAPPPPPPAQPTPEVQPVTKIQPVVVSPPPIVQTPASPPMIATAPEAPPAPVQVVAPPSVASGPPAPVTPPDFDADQLKNPAPKYPLASRRNKEKGTVRIKVLVSPQGAVQEIKIDQTSGFERLDKAALDVVRHWKFLPAKQAGQPVAAWVIVPIPFRLT